MKGACFNDYLLELSEDDGTYDIPKKQAPWKDIDNKLIDEYDDFDKIYDNYEYEYEYENDEDECIIDDTTEITFVFRNHKISDKKLSTFIKFCCKKRLFDDTFYDYSNEFSVVATKLPDTFYMLSKGKDTVSKKKFKSVFRNKFKYKGDIEYIYNLIDETNVGSVSWTSFKDFFLPFVKNVTL